MPLVLFAENGQMTDEQMQQMMENTGKMQECMAKVDQKAMDALTAKGEKVNAEIKNLCAAGKRDEAQKMAIDYGKEMAASKEMQAMQKCGEMAKGMMPQGPGSGDGKKPGHVCDGM
jgi:hypothetical protein